MKILEHYHDSLTGLGLKVTEEGVVCLPNGTPLTIGDDVVTLPLKELQKKNKWDGIHPYHPLCEDVLMGMSDTARLLQRVIEKSLTVSYIKLVTEIIKVAVDPKLLKQCKNPAVKKFLTAYADIKPVNDKGVAEASTAWKSIYDKKFCADEMFLRIAIHREQVIDEVLYLRDATVWCPLLDTDESSKREVFGVDMPTIKCATGMRNLINAIVEPIDKSFGSNAPAPYYDVLMQFYVKAITRHNELAKMFSEVADVSEVDIAWTDELSEIESFRKRIPTLPGNAGVPMNSDEPKKTTVEDENPFGRLKIAKSRDVENDEPPWEEPTRRRPERNTGKSLSSILNRGRDDEDDEDDRRERRSGSRRRSDRDRSSSRDSGRRRDSGRGSRRESSRSGRRSNERRSRDGERRSGNLLSDLIG